jgi:hypothetical protein
LAFTPKWSNLLHYRLKKEKYMSLLNNNNKKDKKKGKQTPSNNKSSFLSPKSNLSTKAATRNTKLTGGSQRGS